MTASVYDFEAINPRLEQIKQERLQAPIEHAMQSAVENYMAGEEPEQIWPKLYMGWDRFPPVNVTGT